MKNFYIFIILFFCFSLSSCAILDTPKRIAGYSVQKFEKEDKGKFSYSFEITKEQAFEKTVNFLKDIKARITHQSYKKGYIVAFDFSKSFDYCLDSTELAFFFEETNNQTEIKVISNNSLLAKNVADEFFKFLSNTEESTIK